MKAGDVVLAHHIRQIAGQDDNGKPTMQVDWSAPPGYDFVFVYVGRASRSGVFKVDDAMKALGWIRDN